MTRGHKSAALVLLVVGAVACGGAQHGAGAAEDPLAPAKLFPLAQGDVWSYDVTQEGDTTPTLQINRVVSHHGNRYALASWSGSSVTYEVRPDGIWRSDTGTWLLRAPIHMGAHWPSVHGKSARVTAVGVHMETMEGGLNHCIQVEESGGESRLRTATVYCAGVGMVYMEAEIASSTGQPTRVEAKLRGHLLAQ